MHVSVLAKFVLYPITCNILYLAGPAFYICWGNSACSACETNCTLDTCIVESSNTAYANGDYCCLPDNSDDSTPQTAEKPTLNLKDVTDSNRKTVLYLQHIQYSHM